MDRSQYIEKSSKLKLPGRCPIYAYCQRKAFTVLFLSYHGQLDDITSALTAAGEYPEDYELNEVKMIGDPTEYSAAEDFFYFRNACPEVCLYSQHRPFAASELALSDASYSKGNHGWKADWEYTKHYSECSEFSAYQFSHGAKPRRVPQTKRTPISKMLRFEIYTRDNYTCQYCGRTKDDGIRLELDHVIPVSKGGKDTYENLRTVCNICNSGKSDKSL